MCILPADTQTLWHIPRGVADVNVYPTRRYTDALYIPRGVADVNVYPTRRYTDALYIPRGVADVNVYPTRRYTDALAHTKWGGRCKCVSYPQIHRRSGTYQGGWHM